MDVSRKLTGAAAVLAVLGIAIAGYLTWVHFNDLSVVCVGGGEGCATVQSSDYAKFLGVPVAVIGVVGYILILASVLIPGTKALNASVFLTIGGWLFSAYLTYLELFVINAICQWCVASFVVLTSLLTVVVWRWLTADG